MFDIPEELKKLPDKPGVYLMHDKNDAIIYVGKAVSLKNRVRQYFQSSRNKTSKIEKMVSLIDHFEYIITDSELEALVLECNLIKEHRPKYNTMLTDDKTYPYIKVTLGEDFPRVLFSRQMKKDKSRYFGPYTSADAVRETIDLLKKLYQIRSCNRVLPRDVGKERPCLNYHIKRCSGPCQGYISKEDYRQNIEEILAFLNGNYSKILSKLEESMKEAAERLEFEKAGEYKELLRSVKQIAQKQKISNSDGEDKDIIAMAKKDSDAVIQVFFVRGGKMIGREHFYMKFPAEDQNGKILGSFIKQFYGGTPYIPKELILQEEVEDAPLLAKWLSDNKGQKVYLHVPQKGQKEKLVELAEKNAQMVLDQDTERIKREEGRTIGAVKQIAALLGLDRIERMEAYDISNTSGYQSVGSMVVYEKGKPLRSDYRKFKLKTVVGPDDYASMREVLTRRFTHGLDEIKKLEEKGLPKQVGSFAKFPDLIMMDGGKGQVNIALEVISKLNLEIPICGMVKDDHHRTRGLYYNNQEIPIDIHSEGFNLITRIQDEAHRFAIEYHRSLRGQSQVKSILDDIPGIGNTRRRALMKAFEGIEQIKEASVEELNQLPEMNLKAAQAVYGFFHS